MDVTYISTTFAHITDNKYLPLLTTRIMTKILNNQKRLNVTYSDIPKDVTIEYYKYTLKTLNNTTNNYTTFQKEFIKNNIHTIDTDYVLLTVGNPWEIIFLIELLKIGKKVVIGGSFVKLYSLKIIREIVQVNGGINLENLLIIRPYINERIDLYEVIKNWKDMDLDVIFDTSDLYINSTEDYGLDFLTDFTKNGLEINRVPLYLSTFCAWGKCTFCYYRDNVIKKQFYTKENLKQTITETIELLKHYNTNNIIISNPEFYFTPDNIEMLKIFKEHNVKILVLVSIKLLKNEKYFNNIMKYNETIDVIMPGIESMDDFALDLIGKDITYTDVFDVIIKLIDFNNTISDEGNRIAIICMFMANLATKNNESVIENYNRQHILFDLLEESNTSFRFSTSTFNFMPLTEYVTDNPYLKPRGHHLTLLNDYQRFDENGNEMLKDDQIVDIDLYNKLIKQFKY